MEGSFPADLRLDPEEGRFPEAEVDLTVAVDSFPADLALVVVRALEEVDGAISGRVRVGGTPAQLAPVGALHLGGGSAFVPGLGIRFDGVDAAFALNPDGNVEVEGTFRSEGTGRVTGGVFLHPITDPVLNLDVAATQLLAVSRRDVEARVSGEVSVTQSYRRPRVTGSLRVDGGVLMVEELARTAEVVDLSDPFFMSVLDEGGGIRPIVEASQNPFLQNLRLAVDLSMSRGSWLRGKDLNVEMNGDLQVFWDRTERDLALVGELQAIRGAYRFWNRQFQVEEGSVSFLGTPGVNPNLNIQATHSLRTPEERRLKITASLSGTLLAPRVALSSDADFAIAESDLVSYLIFGRPSYALASGQSRAVLGAAGGAGANFALGTISSQLGSVVANDFGLDFLAITQGDYFDPFGDLGPAGTMATTQVEIGQYLTDDVYAALLWRPLTDLASTGQTPFAGLRVEWQVADLWTLEGFVEDRYSRSPVFRAGNLGYRLEKLKGFFFWREWGY
jgi:autotransporter translocation and assembly factor TamB